MSVIVKLIPQSDTSNTHLKNLQQYIAKPDANQESGLDVWYFNAIDDKSAHAEMLALNEANSRASNTFKHLLISFSPDVFPSRYQAHEASQLLLKEMGLDECVSMVGLHYDKDHVHLHVAIVTIDPETFKSVHAEWAIEAMHRAAAKINYIQGWKSQNNQLYSVINVGDEVVAVRNSNKGRTLNANEVSAFQGQRSAAEIAAEVVKRAFKDQSINAWDAFHQRMADNGMEYQKKGSGSIFMIEQGAKPVAVKASVINRNATMKLLVSKFGPFISNTYPVLKRQPEPIKGMNDSVKQSWQNFRNLKVLLTKEKAALKNSQSMQYQILLHGQEVARKNIFSQSWKGRGTELNKERMVLAARQAQQKAKLKQIHMSERIKSIQSFHQKYGSTTRFDNYLNSKDANLLTQHKEQQRQAKMESKIFPGAIEKVSNPTFSKVTGIEAYEFYQESISSDMGQLFVLNFTNQDGRIDFVDQGKRIKVINIERGSVRAFLQLSSQKWQKFELTGSLEFKYLCAEEALKLHIDIKITNPEIQRMMTHIRKLENTKKNGASTPGLKLRRWDKPIVVKPRPLKDVSFIQISNPINALQLAINAYLTHAQDLGAKPKNDYLRDLEIAIRMQATGYSDVDISHSINHASPLVIGKEVHNKYINHLVNVINGPLMKEEWKDVVMKKVQEWTALTNNLLQFNPMTRPKF